MNIRKHKKTILLYLSLFLAFAVIIIIAANFKYIISTLRQPPKPVLVSKTVVTQPDPFSEFKGGATIQAVVRNDGGDGHIVLTGTFYQGKQKWTSDHDKFFKAGETDTMIVFVSNVLVGYYSYRLDFHAFK